MGSLSNVRRFSSTKFTQAVFKNGKWHIYKRDSNGNEYLAVQNRKDRADEDYINSLKPTDWYKWYMSAPVSTIFGNGSSGSGGGGGGGGGGTLASESTSVAIEVFDPTRDTSLGASAENGVAEITLVLGACL